MMLTIFSASLQSRNALSVIEQLSVGSKNQP